MPQRKRDAKSIFAVVYYDNGGAVVLSESRRGYGPEDIWSQVNGSMPPDAVRYEAFPEGEEVRRMPEDITVSLRTLLRQHGVSLVHSP